MSPDVVVIGAGIVGAATAWELARRGASVALLDRGEVSGGTTGLGEGNVLCADKDAGPELALTLLGRARYDELEAVVGPAARIRRKGALIVHADARTWADEPARARRLRDAGVDATLVAGAAAVRSLEPELADDVLGAVHVPGDLQCDPRAIARALAAEAQRHGATVLPHTAVRSILMIAGRYVGGVMLADGTRMASGTVVLAAGPWSRALAEGAGLPLPLEPRKGQLVRLRRAQPDEGFLRHKLVDGRYLLSVGSAEAGRQLSTVVETTWDGDLIVGSSRERCGFDPTVDPGLAVQLRARAARLVPAVAGWGPADTWVGFRPWLPDGLPAIGPSDRVPGLWVGTGHEGAGVALGPITGQLLAEGLTGAPPAMDWAPFAPDRFASSC